MNIHNGTYNITFKGVAKKEKRVLWGFEYNTHVLPRETNRDNLGIYEVSLEVQDLVFEGKRVNNIVLIGPEDYLRDKVKIGENELNIFFDRKDFKIKNGVLKVGRGVEIEKASETGTSNHSNYTASASENGDSWWIEDEETDHKPGAEVEVEENNNVKPEASTTTESEEVAQIRRVMERGQEILSMGKYMDIKDAEEMKNLVKQLENFESRGSEAAKNEIFPIPEFKEQFNELIQGLKGKAAAIELEKKQPSSSGSSQSNKPTQPTQAEILASIQQENEAKKNDQNNALNQAEKENAIKEDVVNAIKGSASNFGDESFQEQQRRQEVLEEKLAVEDFELYVKTMIDRVTLALKENNLKETELKLTDELRNQWTRLNRKVIQDKDQVKQIVQQIQEQIIRQGNEKELKSIRERVEQNIKKPFSKIEQEKLIADIHRYLAKTRTNAYVKNNVSKGEALLREFNNSKPKTTEPSEFPWVPVSLGIGAVAVLAVAVLMIRKRKGKRL